MPVRKKRTTNAQKSSLPNTIAPQSGVQPSSVALNHLLQKRYHGASNIRGVQYQVLYFCLRAFDLFLDDGPDCLLGEGLEDIDLWSVRLGNEYVQVKHLGRPMDQSIFGGIVSSFRDVLVADPSAKLRIVTDARWSGKLDTLQNATNEGQSLTASARANLGRLLGPDFPVTPEEFLQRLKFERISEPQICERLEAAIVERFGVANGNEALYVQALFHELMSRSGNRIEVNRTDLTAVHMAVEELVSAGTVNPAVRDGYIQRLAFVSEGHTEDYYEGRAARPGHIASRLDVPRPKIMARIEEVFRRHSVCVVVTSSGQGKSTLGYRYCHDRHLPQTTYTLKACQTEADVGQICRFLRSQMRAKLPLLILVDNLSARTELWHRVASALAGEPVTFLVTARQEDWFRYAGQTAGFSWAVVTPYLSLEEAKQIFAELSKRGRIVPGVTSAGAAYEKVQDRQLLIEYIYLLTHGHLLHERLEEQIAALHQSDQDPGMVEAIRLVSTAHHYGAQVRAERLAAHAGFRQDPQQGLRALENEYILCSQGVCEGLHPVRSEHLMNILHGPLPVEGTLEKLIAWLDPADLETLVGSALANPAIQTGRLLKALVERCLNAAPGLIATVARACFHAEEQRHYLKHQSVFDQAYRDAGDAGVHMLAMYTMPYGSMEPLKALAETLPEARAAADALAHLSGRFQPRLHQQRLEHQLLSEVLPRLDAAQFAADLPALAEVLHWGYYAHIPPQRFREILRHSQWQENIFALPLEAACSLAYALSRVAPEEYGTWYKEERQRIFSYFKWRSRTLSVLEEGDTVRIEYALEWSSEASSPNEQSVSRLYALSRLLADYQTYCSRGIHLLGEDVITDHDETIKNLTRESIWQKVDSSKNEDWIRLCQQKYAIDSLTNWLAKWKEIRQHSLTLVQQLCGTYDRLYREQPITQKRSEEVINLLNKLQQGFQRAPSLPGTLAPLERKRLEKLMADWTAHFSNFVRQYTEHNPLSSEDHYSRLMRINLKNAIKAFPDFDEALGSVAMTFG